MMIATTRVKRIWMAAIVALCGAAVHAQDGGLTAAPPSSIERLTVAERRSAVNGALGRLADPTMTSAAGGPTPTLLLEASATTKTAGARIGMQAGDWLIDLQLRGVVSSRSATAVFADLDGVRHSSTARIGLVWTTSPRAVAPDRLVSACHEYARVAPPGIDARSCSLAALRAVPQSSRDEAAGRRPSSPANAVAQRLAPHWIWLASVAYTFGPERFTFVRTPTANDSHESRVNWAVSARSGVVIHESLSVGAEYERAVAYRSGDQRQICAPVSGATAGVLECADVVVGPPTRVRSHLATIEARVALAPGLAVNPRLSVNPLTGGFRISVPTYFLKDSKGGLVGGATLGWRYSPTRGSALEMTVFAGQVFGVILK
jgi:hypothetical protein